MFKIVNWMLASVFQVFVIVSLEMVEYQVHHNLALHRHFF